MPPNQNGRSSHSGGLPKSVSGYEVSFREKETFIPENNHSFMVVKSNWELMQNF